MDRLLTHDAWLGHGIVNIGKASFHARLLEAMHTMLGADHFSHLSYDRQGRICHASAASVCDQSLIDSTTALYVNGLYKRDPIYPLVCDATPSAAWRAPELRLVCLSPTAIRDVEYRRLLFDRPGFINKVSLLSRWIDRSCYLNFYFSRTPLDASRVETLLGQYGSTLMSLAYRHEELSIADKAPERAFFMTLSSRERETAELLMRGLTAKEIGRVMALSPTTVVTYKERVYAKLGVTSLREFLLKVGRGGSA
jgi:DNA-binding CsgD family transcriptional regulator